MVDSRGRGGGGPGVEILIYPSLGTKKQKGPDTSRINMASNSREKNKLYCAKWRAKNKRRYNSYMAKYMKRRRQITQEGLDAS